jgi:hypothetical protein
MDQIKLIGKGYLDLRAFLWTFFGVYDVLIEKITVKKLLNFFNKMGSIISNQTFPSYPAKVAVTVLHQKNCSSFWFLQIECGNTETTIIRERLQIDVSTVKISQSLKRFSSKIQNKF